MTINADGASSEVKFQANGVEKASISAAGAFTSTTIDATKLTGTIPNFTSTGIDDNATSTAITIDSSENVSVDTGNLELGSAQYVKNGKFYMTAKPAHAEYSRFKAPCDCSIVAHASQYVTTHVAGPYNGIEVRLGQAGSTTLYGYYTSSDISGQYAYKSTSAHTFSDDDTVEFWTQAPYGSAYGKWWTIVLEITPT